MSKLSTQPPKGFRDLYPEDRAVQNWLFDTFKKTVESFGYQNYEGPTLESIDLYKAKSSDELVNKQTFQLKDRGNRDVALRPEMTPTLARMIAGKQQDTPFPARWYTIGKRFRYEAPQKGRAREFYQMDADMLGIQSPESDAEIIAVALTFLQSLGLTPKDIVLTVNNRQSLELLLNKAEIKPSHYPSVIKCIDDRDKLSADEWASQLMKQGLSEKQIVTLTSNLDDVDTMPEAVALVVDLLRRYELADYVAYDPGTVRGLDYYTGTVFEVRDRKNAYRAILGGGRYDNLVELFGGQAVSGIGFACGDMVLTELLTDLQKLPTTVQTVQTLVTIFDSGLYTASLELANTLRSSGLRVSCYPDPHARLDKQLKYADRIGMDYALILGPDESESNTITVKNLTEKSQKTIPQSDIRDYLSR